MIDDAARKGTSGSVLGLGVREDPQRTISGYGRVGVTVIPLLVRIKGV